MCAMETTAEERVTRRLACFGRIVRLVPTALVLVVSLVCSGCGSLSGIPPEVRDENDRKMGPSQALPTPGVLGNWSL